jgi:hypothetical protein
VDEKNLFSHNEVLIFENSTILEKVNYFRSCLLIFRSILKSKELRKKGKLIIAQRKQEIQLEKSKLLEKVETKLSSEFFRVETHSTKYLTKEGKEEEENENENENEESEDDIDEEDLKRKEKELLDKAKIRNLKEKMKTKMKQYVPEFFPQFPPNFY